MLAHRPTDARPAVRQRFVAAGVSAPQVDAVLRDAGDGLYAAAVSGRPGWERGFGGAPAAALLAAEVSALTAHLNSRASAVRGAAVGSMLDEFSAIAVAAHLGVSRQKVYDIARGGPLGQFLPNAPWRQP